MRETTLEKLSKTEDLLIRFMENAVERQENDMATPEEIEILPEVAKILSDVIYDGNLNYF